MNFLNIKSRDKKKKKNITNLYSSEKEGIYINYNKHYIPNMSSEGVARNLINLFIIVGWSSSEDLMQSKFKYSRKLFWASLEKKKKKISSFPNIEATN